VSASGSKKMRLVSPTNRDSSNPTETKASGNVLEEDSPTPSGTN
jgi:hypothetical protein